MGGRDNNGLLPGDRDSGSGSDSDSAHQGSSSSLDKTEGGKKDKNGAGEEIRPQPWYFHVVASIILVVHGFTFLVPQDPEVEDTDMVRTVARWMGYDMEWVKQFTPYAQVRAQ